MKPDRAAEPAAGRAAMQVVLIYALVAALWILFSDRAVAAIFSDPAQIIRASLVKGWLFVAVTALLLYGLVYRLEVRQIAARRREQAMQAEKLQALQLIETIAESSDDAIFAKDIEGRYILFNRAAAAFVGQPAAAVLGRDDRALFPAAQAEMLMLRDRAVLRENRISSVEECLDTAAGARVFLATKGPLHDAEGKVSGLFGISRDITERTQAESRLRDREAKLSAIVTHSPSVLSLKSPDGRYALANPNLQGILGLSEAEIVGKTDLELFPADTARSFRANDERVLQTRGRHAIEEILPVDGQPRTFLSHMFPVLGESGELRFICRISLDISERKKADAELKQLTDDLRATLHAIPDLLFELDASGRYVKVEATAHQLLAAPPEQLLGRRVDEMLPPAAARTVMAALAGAASHGSDYGRTITLPLPAGARHFELSVARKAVAAGQMPRFIVLSRDVTLRCEVEEELRRNNEELQRFNRATVGRELDMIELKERINALSLELGRPRPYALDFIMPHDAARQ